MADIFSNAYFNLRVKKIKVILNHAERILIHFELTIPAELIIPA